ncbi:MAG: hypothetical protein KDA28_01280, partial [Phycisphaerales bacterium]|nr:hypothetical protein [Phycisphaerales bacterium]
DVHSHINGARASEIFRDVMDLYGIERVHSMSRLPEAAAVRRTLGDRVRFIAVPDYGSEDRTYAMREGFLEGIRIFREEYDARILKFWAAPRLRDFVDAQTFADVGALDAPWRRKAADLAVDLGMTLMVHVADPDTWFATKYADASVYGTKAQQYEALERMLETYTCPWLAAHMGGWPEDLACLDTPLGRYDHLHLDTSATRWMIRELSKHPRADLVDFLTRWKGRILFGSDIVTNDEHLQRNEPDGKTFAADLASGPREAFDLYASRYWALRTMWETDYDGESPISDPDLAMVDPETHTETDAPPLRGKSIPDDLLDALYAQAALGLYG